MGHAVARKQAAGMLESATTNGNAAFGVSGGGGRGRWGQIGLTGTFEAHCEKKNRFRRSLCTVYLPRLGTWR